MLSMLAGSHDAYWQGGVSSQGLMNLAQLTCPLSGLPTGKGMFVHAAELQAAFMVLASYNLMPCADYQS